MDVKSIKDLDLKGKRVLIRVDFNVPLKEGRITDDTRIRRALPTLITVLEQEGASLILMTHLGRPTEDKEPHFSTRQLREALSRLTGAEVLFSPSCVGQEAERLSAELKPGMILLLENTRYDKREQKNDPAFAKKLARLGDVYVNDAFGAAHRAHASTEGITHYLPSAAGLLMEKECHFFGTLLEKASLPFAAIIGGAKISSKIAVLESLLSRCSSFVIGGGMAYTFLKARGHSIGNSLYEADFLNVAKSFLEKAEKKNVTVVLPEDHVMAGAFKETASPEPWDAVDIPEGKLGMDIGPETVAKIATLLADAATILWNGPMGVFEFPAFAKGTEAVAKLVAESRGLTVVGGGDSVAAVNAFHLADQIDHVSTGGGASLEYLEGKPLPGVLALERAFSQNKEGK